MPESILKQLRVGGLRFRDIRLATTGGTAPGQPTGLTATTYGAARIDLAWTASTGATSYLVERSPAGAGTWSAVTYDGIITGTTWLDTGLAGSTGYDYRVSAVGAGGTSSPSGTATATTTATGLSNGGSPGSVTTYKGAGYVPATPFEFAAVPFSSSVINTTWNTGINGTAASGITYFSLQRSPDGTNWRTIFVSTGTPWTPYSDTGLAANTPYYYQIFTGNTYGEAAGTDYNGGSEPTTAHYTYAAGAPTLSTAPGLCAAPLSPTSIQVRWLAVQCPEGVAASSYTLQRSSDGGATWTPIATQAGTIYTDSTGLSAGQTYDYRFAATGAGGTSAWSPTVSATTLAARSGRALLQPQDFTYLGGFSPTFFVDPNNPNPVLGSSNDVRSSYATSGIGFRYVTVNGTPQLRIMALTNPGHIASSLYEFEPPAEPYGTSDPYPPGTAIKYWGDPYNGLKLGLYSAGYNLSVVDWGTGSGVATTGVSNLILGIDSSGFLHLRRFDSGGTLIDIYEATEAGATHIIRADGSGNIIKDVDESTLTTSQASAVSDLKAAIPGWLPPYVLADADVSRALSDMQQVTDIFFSGTALNVDHDPSGSSWLRDRTSDGGFTSAGFCADPAVANRFWIGYANWYNVDGTTSPCLLRIDLDDANGTIATTGPYRFDEHAANSPTNDKTASGVNAIPQWFADGYLNQTIGGTAYGASGDTWRMGGFGGNEAGAAAASYGPSIVAFNAGASGYSIAGKECHAQDIGYSSDAGLTYVAGDANRQTPLITSITLAGFIYNTDWATRPPGQIDPSGIADGFKADGPGVGYFYTGDRIKGGTVWIDDDAGSRAKHGVLVAAAFAFGHDVYKAGNTLTGGTNGGPSYDGGQAFGLAIIDPADLASVAAGTLSPGAVPVQPACWWMPTDIADADQRVTPYTGNFGTPGSAMFFGGAAFDPSTNRLYLCVANGGSASGHSETVPVIHVYQVAT